MWFLISLALAQTPWIENRPFTVLGTIYDLDSADLDGDGDVDIALAASSVGLAWLENTGGGWSEPVTLLDGDVRSFAILDADSDGDPDLAAAHLIGVYLLENDAGSFSSAPVHELLTGLALEVETADFDGDGDPDLVGAWTALGDQLYSYTDPATTAVVTPIDPWPNLGLLAADLDEDGDDDLVTRGGPTGLDLTVFLGTALGLAPALPTGSADLHVIGDTNSDDIPDLVTWNALTGELSVRLNLGSGAFAPATSIATLADEVIDLAIGDVDNDGFPDLVVSTTPLRDPTVLVYSGLQLPALELDPVSRDATLHLADLDGDGLIDLLTGGGGLVLSPGGAGALPGTPEVLYLAAVPNHLVTLDLDADGLDEIVLSDYGADAAFLLDRTGQGWNAWTLLDSGTVGGLATGDFDGDLDLDLALIENSVGEVVWYANEGTGQLGTRTVVDSAAACREYLSTGDHDGDGDVDMVSVDQCFDVELSWIEAEAGVFAPEVRVLQPLVSNFLSWAISVDVDGDGDPDPLAGNPLSGELAWSDDLAPGSLAVGLLLDLAVDRALPADLDGDGLPDLLLTRLGSNDLLVRYASGPATFGVDTPLGIACSSFGAADLDDDGDVDLVCATTPATVYENVGGSLVPRVLTEQPTAFASTGAVSFPDADHDGDPDILVWGPSGASLLFNPGGEDRDGDGFSTLTDCDDGQPGVYPGAPELCDGVDTNCDGVLPEDESDADGDGTLACEGDCNDADPTVAPGLPEACDGLDTDCDGTIPGDEIDTDSDGLSACAGDCDDTNPTVAPGLPELCDGLDNDCDGATPADEVDDDGDGMSLCAGDCNDADPAVYDGAPEQCDLLDNDCDLDIDEDLDSDGDGLCDDLDPCPADLVDDSDGDGVCDSDDPCPIDPADDSDGDGVCDSDDPCPIDPADDSDGDGSCDSDELCEGNDPSGDSDGDGVCDDIDLCEGDDASGDADRDGACADIDCEEGRADMSPLILEKCGDELDNDCDGSVDELCDDVESVAPPSATGCTCDHTPVVPAVWLFLPALLLRRRCPRGS